MLRHLIVHFHHTMYEVSLGNILSSHIMVNFTRPTGNDRLPLETIAPNCANVHNRPGIQPGGARCAGGKLFLCLDGNNNLITRS